MGLAGQWLGKQLAIGTESNTGLSYSVPSSMLGENSLEGDGHKARITQVLNHGLVSRPVLIPLWQRCPPGAKE